LEELVPGLPMLMVAKTVEAQTMTEEVINNNRRTAGETIEPSGFPLRRSG